MPWVILKKTPRLAEKRRHPTRWFDNPTPVSKSYLQFVPREKTRYIGRNPAGTGMEKWLFIIQRVGESNRKRLHFCPPPIRTIVEIEKINTESKSRHGGSLRISRRDASASFICTVKIKMLNRKKLKREYSITRRRFPRILWPPVITDRRHSYAPKFKTGLKKNNNTQSCNRWPRFGKQPCDRILPTGSPSCFIDRSMKSSDRGKSD